MVDFFHPQQGFKTGKQFAGHVTDVATQVSDSVVARDAKNLVKTLAHDVYHSFPETRDYVKQTYEQVRRRVAERYLKQEDGGEKCVDTPEGGNYCQAKPERNKPDDNLLQRVQHALDAARDELDDREKEVTKLGTSLEDDESLKAMKHILRDVTQAMHLFSMNFRRGDYQEAREHLYHLEKQYGEDPIRDIFKGDLFDQLYDAVLQI